MKLDSTANLNWAGDEYVDEPDDVVLLVAKFGYQSEQQYAAIEAEIWAVSLHWKALGRRRNRKKGRPFETRSSFEEEVLRFPKNSLVRV